MEISWLGHSCIRLKGRGESLIADPYGDALGLSLGKARAEIVTVSNAHPNHSTTKAVGGGPTVIDGPGEYEIADFYISGIGTQHGDESEDPRLNTVYVIQVAGLSLCHVGDLDRPLSPQQIQQVGQTDVLFVPAGGGCTISPSQAVELVGQLTPRIVIPIHYATGELTAASLGPLDAFLADMGLIEVSHQTTLEVAPSSLPRDITLVVLDRSP